MKELTVKVTEDIAKCIACDAKEKGLNSEELIKYILGGYVQEVIRCSRAEQRGISGIAIAEGMSGLLEKLFTGPQGIKTDLLKHQADQGALSCKLCTMKMSSADIDNGKCGACGAPLKNALGNKEEGNKPE